MRSLGALRQPRDDTLFLLCGAELPIDVFCNGLEIRSRTVFFKCFGMTATLWSAAVFRRFCGKREDLPLSVTTPI